VLQVEMTGQLGLCLVHFIGNGTYRISEDAAPAEVRALRVHHAQYLLPIVPGDLVEVHAALLEEDAMTATCAGQVVKEGKVVSLAVQEVYFVE
jgi:3-hydroxymyristoyl/3-hydroxydecanoyl-(acyl carrier protein) dehydratase